MGASADGIVHCACGKRHWGHAGAAGVLAWKEAEDPSVILQLRAAWSMSGGTWGIPGGAIDYDETPIQGGLREAREEAGMGPVRVWASTTLHHPDWSYTTAIAEASPDQRAIATDHESDAMEWTKWKDLRGRRLMPAFETTLPLLDSLLGRSLLVLDPTLLHERWEESLLRFATLGFPINVAPVAFRDPVVRGARASADEDFDRSIAWFPDIVLLGTGKCAKPIAARGAIPPSIRWDSDVENINTDGYRHIAAMVSTNIPGAERVNEELWNHLLRKNG